MEWLYIIGIGLNACGYNRLGELMSGLDNNVAGIANFRNISVIGGLFSLIAGFYIFDWWIPVIGLTLGIFVIGIISTYTFLYRLPQLSMLIGLAFSIISILNKI